MVLSAAGKRKAADERDQRLRQIGQRVRDRRQELALSQRGLAERLGVSPPNITRIEGGNQNLTVDTMCKLAEALEMPLDELFSGRSDLG